MKSFAVEGTVFWLVVSAIFIAASIDPTVTWEAASGLVTAGVYLVIAYACWKPRKWAFVAATAIALFTTVGSLALSFSFGTTSIFKALSESAFLVVPQLMLILFSLRAYRE